MWGTPEKMTNSLRKGQQCTGVGKTLTLRIPVDSVSTCASSGDQKASFRVPTKAGRGSGGPLLLGPHHRALAWRRAVSRKLHDAPSSRHSPVR